MLGRFASLLVRSRLRREIDLVWSTGEPRRYWRDGQPYLEQLSLDPGHVRLDRLVGGGIPLLASHEKNCAAVIGVLEAAWVLEGRAYATARFLSRGIDPLADRHFEKVRDQVLTNVSMGYTVHKWEKTEGVGMPFWRAVEWDLEEISLVAVNMNPLAKVIAVRGR